MADFLARGGLKMTLTDEVLAELKATAQALCAPGNVIFPLSSNVKTEN